MMLTRFHSNSHWKSSIMCSLFRRRTLSRLIRLDDPLLPALTNFLQYNTSVATPYWFRKYILMKKNQHLEPLIQVDEDVQIAAATRTLSRNKV